MIALLRYWPAAVAVLLLAGMVAYHKVQLGHARKAGYAAATAEMAEKVAIANAATAALEQRQRKQIYEAENAHQKALSDLDARYASQRVPAVRLCPPAARGRELPRATRPAALDPDPAGTDRFPGGSTPDLGPQLERLVRAADEQTQRLVACQAFVEAQRVR